jgi:hypothetical protein
MPKFAGFEVYVEVEKLKIQIKGDRAITTEISDQVSHQISSMLQPSAYLEAPAENQNGQHVIDAPPASTAGKRRKRGSSKQPVATAGGAGQLDWAHDAAKYGTPVQDWKQWQKIAWLLHVVEQEGIRKDLSPSEMADIYKNKFRAAGLLTRQNIARDLNTQTDYFGSVDGRWFLKQGGKAVAATLVAEAKGEKASAAANV